MKPGSVEISMGTSCQCVRDSVLVRSSVSAEIGDGHPCKSKNTGFIDMLETSEAPENGHVIIWLLPQKTRWD